MKNSKTITWTELYAVNPAYAGQLGGLVATTMRAKGYTQYQSKRDATSILVGYKDGKHVVVFNIMEISGHLYLGSTGN